MLVALMDSHVALLVTQHRQSTVQAVVPGKTPFAVSLLTARGIYLQNPSG